MPEQTNRLIHEKSPYLLQHAHNPVDWYPWGEEAFTRARSENKPIFLSIGYATCHWCHVMEKESFEDQAVADLLNRDYVCIKVDREERPDIDQVYMDVCVRLTGSGGWPLTLFLLPDRQPFFAGTYFPKISHPQRPGLLDYLPLIASRWQKQPREFEDRAREIVGALQAETDEQTTTTTVTGEIFERTNRPLLNRFDPTHGGFGSAPKFPSPHTLAYLLRRYRHSGDHRLLQSVIETLQAMRRGGLFDQVGFGFHRYSTDREWLVPHFEKMLYDQAGLAEIYLEAFQVTQDPALARTAREIFTYVRRDLTDPQGGFYSAQDADSEGVEGKYYLWSTDEVVSVLGTEAGAQFGRVFNLEAGGNYRDEATREKTGQNIPHLAASYEQLSRSEKVSCEQLDARIEAARERLLAHRRLRVPPLTDDKILTAWNGMMISALAAGGRILHDHSYLAAAETAADFILQTLRKADGSLLRRYREGEAAIDAFAEDYAFLAKGVLDLYRATFNPRWLQQAIDLAEQLAERFMDAASGLIYETEASSSELIVRPKNLFDGAHPSTNSVALQLFARLGLLTGDPTWRERSTTLLNGLTPFLHAYPTGFTCALQGAALLLEPTREIVLSGPAQSPELKAMIAAVNRQFSPETEIILRPNDENEAITRLAPFVAQMERSDKAAAYICQNYTCQTPLTDAEALASLLREAP